MSGSINNCYIENYIASKGAFAKRNRLKYEIYRFNQSSNRLKAFMHGPLDLLR
jgi:hypothetical protein